MLILPRARRARWIGETRDEAPSVRVDTAEEFISGACKVGGGARASSIWAITFHDRRTFRALLHSKKPEKAKYLAGLRRFVTWTVSADAIRMRISQG